MTYYDKHPALEQLHDVLYEVIHHEGGGFQYKRDDHMREELYGGKTKLYDGLAKAHLLDLASDIVGACATDSLISNDWSDSEKVAQYMLRGMEMEYIMHYSQCNWLNSHRIIGHILFGMWKHLSAEKVINDDTYECNGVVMPDPNRELMDGFAHYLKLRNEFTQTHELGWGKWVKKTENKGEK